MLKKIDKTLVAAYAYEDYRIEILEMDGEYEAWLQHKDYGVKDLMFGAMKEQTSLDEFVTAVENELDKYIETYEESYY